MEQMGFKEGNIRETVLRYIDEPVHRCCYTTGRNARPVVTGVELDTYDFRRGLLYTTASSKQYHCTRRWILERNKSAGWLLRWWLTMCIAWKF